MLNISKEIVAEILPSFYARVNLLKICKFKELDARLSISFYVISNEESYQNLIRILMY